MRIKELIKSKGLTAKDVAVSSGISEPLLSNIVNGKGNPSLQTLMRIADALGVNVAELFEEDKPITETVCCPKCHALIKVAITKVHIQVIGEQTFTPNDATDTEDNQQNNQQ